MTEYTSGAADTTGGIWQFYAGKKNIFGGIIPK